MIIILALIIGFSAAFIGSLVGLGGGVILVPALLFLHDQFTLFSWATPQTIVGISVVTMVFTGLSSTLMYMKVKRVDVRTAVIFLIGSMPGSVCGSLLNKVFDVKQFSLYFGILMIVVFALMLIDREKIPRRTKVKATKQMRTFEILGETYTYHVPVIPALILAFIVGMMSGLFGIGGGTISVPLMILLFGMPVQIAIGTSMFIIFFTSVISSTTHIYLGHVHWGYVIFFIIASYIGGTVGAKTNTLFKGKTLAWILKAIILITAIRLIYDSIS